jgi:hypothetical protein
VIVLRILLFLLGAAAVFFAIRSAIATFMVPRPLRTYLARVVFIVCRRVLRLAANERHDYAKRDRVMAFYAPVALVTLLVVWVAILIAGFTAMFFALGGVGLVGAFTRSGSSLFTLGFASRGELRDVFLSFVAAGNGLFLLALFITYLPAVYAAFQRRERGVAELEVRAGQPPTGVYLIELAWIVGRLESLRDLWSEWEDWFTDVDESHGSFPPLAFFRSTHPAQSWVTAAGAILDAASLIDSTIATPRTPEPQFMIRSGYLCLRHLADFFLIPVDHDPKPTDPISIERSEFDVAYDHLQRVGVPVRGDRDQCWRDFAGWRVNYDAALIGLARLAMAPPAPWSSDRYEEANFIPRVFSRRRRRSEAVAAGDAARHEDAVRPGAAVD